MLDLAIADYGTAMSLDPMNPEVFYSRGVAYGLDGQLDSATADLETFVLYADDNHTNLDHAKQWINEIRQGDDPFE